MSEKYKIIREIGKGSFGTAFLVKRKGTELQFVLKRVKLARQSERQREASLGEIKLLARLRHPHIVGYQESWIEAGCVACIVVQYCSYGDLLRCLKTASQPFQESTILHWFCQIVLALEYIHKNKILHRDIKCANIFMSENDTLLLGDFGLARTLEGSDELASTVVGTPNYMCPELMLDKPYGYKSDVWALGCVMYEISCLRPAFNAFNMAGLTRKIVHTIAPTVPSIYSKDWRHLIKAMLNKSPDMRPSPSQLLQMPFLQPYVARCNVFVEEKTQQLGSPKAVPDPHAMLEEAQEAARKRKMTRKKAAEIDSQQKIRAAFNDNLQRARGAKGGSSGRRSASQASAPSSKGPHDEHSGLTLELSGDLIEEEDSHDAFCLPSALTPSKKPPKFMGKPKGVTFDAASGSSQRSSKAAAVAAAGDDDEAAEALPSVRSLPASPTQDGEGAPEDGDPGPEPSPHSEPGSLPSPPSQPRDRSPVISASASTSVAARGKGAGRAGAAWRPGTPDPPGRGAPARPRPDPPARRSLPAGLPKPKRLPALPKDGKGRGAGGAGRGRRAAAEDARPLTAEAWKADEPAPKARGPGPRAGPGARRAGEQGEARERLWSASERTRAPPAPAPAPAPAPGDKALRRKGPISADVRQRRSEANKALQDAYCAPKVLPQLFRADKFKNPPKVANALASRHINGHNYNHHHPKDFKAQLPVALYQKHDGV